MMRFNRKLYLIAIALLSFISITVCGNQKSEENAKPIVLLENTINTEALVTHTRELERISLSNTLSRSSTSPGYIQAIDYIKSSLGSSGLTIWEQRFEYRYFLESEDPALSMISPGQKTYVWETDYQTMTYSGFGNVTAEIAFVTPMLPPGAGQNTSTDGCEVADFQGIDLTGKIAVIQRGTCNFIEKASNAESRGAVALLIFNEGQEGRTDNRQDRL